MGSESPRPRRAGRDVIWILHHRRRRGPSGRGRRPAPADSGISARSMRRRCENPRPMTNGSTPAHAAQRSVLWLAWPLVLSFWMRQLFTFVDTYFAATLGDAAVAGIGLAFPFEFLLIAFWVGTSTGMTSLLSRAMGAREGERIEQVVRVTRRVVVALVAASFVLGALIWL